MAQSTFSGEKVTGKEKDQSVVFACLLKYPPLVGFNAKLLRVVKLSLTSDCRCLTKSNQKKATVASYQLF